MVLDRIGQLFEWTNKLGNYHKILEEDLVAGLPTVVPSNIGNIEIVYTVDTMKLFIWHKGVWYPQQ